jgi:hypothetical protein
MATTPDEMTPEKAVRYACRALTEERDRVAVDYDYTALANREERDRLRERIENIDAAMRVLNGLVGR